MSSPSSRIHRFTQGSFGFLIVVVLCLLGRSFSFSGPHNITLDLEWMAVLIVFHRFKGKAAFPGFIVAHTAAAMLFPPRIPGIGEQSMHLALETAFGAGMVLSGLLLKYINPVKRRLPIPDILLLATPVALSIAGGFIRETSATIPYRWIYTVAGAIVCLLAVSRIRSLFPLFSSLLRTWFTGYTFTTLLVCVLSLNPDTAGHPLKCVETLFLAPYAVFLLELLITAHILAGLPAHHLHTTPPGDTS